MMPWSPKSDSKIKSYSHFTEIQLTDKGLSTTSSTAHIEILHYRAIEVADEEALESRKELLKGLYIAEHSTRHGRCFREIFLWDLSRNVIFFGTLNLNLTDMIKRESDGLFEMCKSYLYVVIINEEDKRTREKEKWDLLKKKQKGDSY